MSARKRLAELYAEIDDYQKAHQADFNKRFGPRLDALKPLAEAERAIDDARELDNLRYEANKRWGDPRIDDFGHQHRVWFQNFHFHDGACTSDLAGQRSTLLDCYRQIFEIAKKVAIHPGKCRRGSCPEFAED